MYSHLPTAPHAVDAQGFVLVDGARVINTPGVMLRAQSEYKANCQMCWQLAVTIPLRVVSEFEHAIDARRYFHVGPPGAFAVDEYRLCKECR